MICAECNSKRGFYKFGTKSQLIDANTKPFGISIQLLKDKYEKELSLVFNEQKWKNAICFFELWGKDSFAGNHNFEAPLDITLFDVNPYKQGILEPREFIKLFGHLDTPKVLYEGKISIELFNQIKQSILPGMTFEGCVCKGVSDSNTRMPVIFKIKSRAWLDKLKIYCKGDVNLFSKLE